MAKRSITRDVERVRRGLNNRPIVLVGLMGAGKTSIGRRLAAKLGIAFVEAYFREGERRVIARLLDNGAQVLATGGGAFMNGETRARISAASISVWLRADLPLLMKRVLKRDNRPLLKQDDPESVMRKLMETRYPVYKQANVTVESRDVQHAQMVNEVVKALAEWLSRNAEAEPVEEKPDAS
jgi:shikimate kinase